MRVTINKADLMLETSGSNEIAIRSAGSYVRSLQTSFEGVPGFNEKYIKPLMELMASKHPFYKCIKVIGDLNKSGVNREVIFFNITNIRQTTFLFSTLKTLGISLNELRIGYCLGTEPTLYLHSKIVKMINSLAEEPKVQLTLYLYNLTKFFYAVYKSNADFVQGTSVDPVVEVDKAQLEAIYNTYGSLDESTTIDCEILSEDVSFESVEYVVSPTSKPAKSNLTIPSSCDYGYNYIKDDKGGSLIIINKSFSPKIYYRIVNNTIFTNSELSLYNTFDFSEWMPSLICNLLDIDKISEGSYKLVKLELEQLLYTTSKELNISCEVSDSRFYDFLEKYPNITDNYDMKLYDGYFKGATLKSTSSITSLKDQYNDDNYAQQLYRQIMPHYETFDLKDLTGIVKGFAKGDVYSMLFEGDAGTGKSTAARVIPTKCGIPFVAFNCSTNIEESDMFGTMIPNPEKKSADDPEFIWKDGPATKAIRNGYALVIEEINFARPGILGKLNSLLDEAKQIDLPNGEVLKAHPNFRLIATCNIAYDGTNRMNKALIDRFEICKKFEDLEQKEATAIIKARTGYTDDSKISSIFSVYNAIKKYSTEQNLGLIVSLRRLLTIFTIGKYYKTAKDAINSLILNQAFLEEPEHLKYFKDTVLNAFDLSFKL